MVQIGDVDTAEKPIFASLIASQNVATITLGRSVGIIQNSV